MMYRSRRALPRYRRGPLMLFVAVLAAAALAGPARAFDLSRWPEPAAVNGARSEVVSFPSHSPFTLREVGRGADEDPPTPARAALFLPEAASAANPAPAVVLLHGAAGVLSTREITYAGQFAAMGVAALVVNAFGARRDRLPQPGAHRRAGRPERDRGRLGGVLRRDRARCHRRADQPLATAQTPRPWICG